VDGVAAAARGGPEQGPAPGGRLGVDHDLPAGEVLAVGPPWGGKGVEVDLAGVGDPHGGGHRRLAFRMRKRGKINK
jgi:hypothetical protein